jgi:hypothetical protein
MCGAAALAMLFDGGTFKNFWLCIGLLLLIAIICFISFFTYRKIETNEQQEWLDYCGNLDTNNDPIQRKRA